MQFSYFTVDEPSKYFVQYLTNFSRIVVNLTVSVESSNHDGSDFTTCQDLCANDPLCLSFHHSQGDLQCRLSTSEKSSSGCDACQFYTKNCLPGRQMHWLTEVLSFLDHFSYSDNLLQLVLVHGRETSFVWKHFFFIFNCFLNSTRPIVTNCYQCNFIAPVSGVQTLRWD